SPAIADRWFSWPNMILLSPAPILTAATAIALWFAIKRRHTLTPFILAMTLFLLGYAGLGISTYPNIIPPDIDIWEAASPVESQLFLLVGVLFLFPVILGYTAYSYWVFRGKVTRDAGYHH
ncbi:MAG: cytochrome d ubiquinol oxidase subunit II, partial [Burkholderiales bacterium]